MTPETAIQIQILLVISLAGVGAFLWAMRQARALRDGGRAHGRDNRDSTSSSLADSSPVLRDLDLRQIGKTGAMANPPRDLRVTIRAVLTDSSTLATRYRFPIGWNVVKGIASPSWGTFVGDTNHILLTAQSDGGKDNWAIGVLLSLALTHTPQQIQFFVIDGKGLDFAPWANKAHVQRLALRTAEIAPTMAALTRERERRGEILRSAGASKWENYKGADLPLLVVFISELSLLQDAVGKTELEQWLNSELAAGRAFGMRYIVATQTAANFATRWRSQISLAVAGFQPSASQDDPNTGLRTAEIRALGGTPPSELPAPPAGAGVFTFVFGRMAITVRAPYLDDMQRAQLLSRLPDRSAVATTDDAIVPEPTQADLRALLELSEAPRASSAAQRAAVVPTLTRLIVPNVESEPSDDAIITKWTPQHTTILEMLLETALAGGDILTEPSDNRLMEAAYGKRAKFYHDKTREIRKAIIPIVAATVYGVKAVKAVKSGEIVVEMAPEGLHTNTPSQMAN